MMIRVRRGMIVCDLLLVGSDSDREAVSDDTVFDVGARRHCKVSATGLKPTE